MIKRLSNFTRIKTIIFSSNENNTLRNVKDVIQKIGDVQIKREKEKTHRKRLITYCMKHSIQPLDNMWVVR